MIGKYGLTKTKAKSAAPGDKFGRLTVVAIGEKGKYRYHAVCICECGNEVCVRIDLMKSGSTTSCGCYHKEVTTKHGMHKSPHYRRWLNMIDRCENTDCSSYPDYGGRGISVCERWHDVALFIADLPGGYKEGMQMDRINNNGNYEPGNIRWVYTSDNCSNRRSTRLITANGITKTAKQWSIDLGGNENLVTHRIEKYGWSELDAVTMPVQDQSETGRMVMQKRWEGHIKKPSPPAKVIRKVVYNGNEYTANQIADMAGRPLKLVQKQLYERGWSAEKVITRGIDWNTKG